MEDKIEKAGGLFHCGYNCAQAVFAAFAPELGIDFDTALRLSSSFGGGMGRLREVCGAVSAMFMIAGLKYGYSDPADPAAKAAHYERIRALAEEFREKNGSIICRELLESQNRSESGHNSVCEGLVRSAAEMIEKSL